MRVVVELRGFPASGIATRGVAGFFLIGWVEIRSCQLIELAFCIVDALTCKNNNGAQLDLYNYFPEEVGEFFLFLRGLGPIWCRDLKIWGKNLWHCGVLMKRWRARIGWLCGVREKYKILHCKCGRERILIFYIGYIILLYRWVLHARSR